MLLGPLRCIYRSRILHWFSLRASLIPCAELACFSDKIISRMLHCLLRCPLVEMPAERLHLAQINDTRNTNWEHVLIGRGFSSSTSNKGPRDAYHRPDRWNICAKWISVMALSEPTTRAWQTSPVCAFAHILYYIIYSPLRYGTYVITYNVFRPKDHKDQNCHNCQSSHPIVIQIS